MNPFITPNTLDKCKLSFADFVKPVELLDKDATYIIGNFTVQDKTFCIALKNGNYYFTTNNAVVKKDCYNFPTIQRAFMYFEKLYYGESY